MMSPQDMLDTVSIKSLREHTYQAIKSSILQNKLLPGQHISIGELAGQLGISETPVREALAVLKGEGLIDYEPHRKVQIARVTEEDVRQVYEVRRLLEPHAVRLAIESIPKDRDLKASLERMNEEVKGGNPITEALSEPSQNGQNEVRLRSESLRKTALFLGEHIGP